MALSCTEPARLLAHIENSYPRVVKSAATAIGTTKFTFPDKLVVNIYSTGTVTFQGMTSDIIEEIKHQIEVINRT